MSENISKSLLVPSANTPDIGKGQGAVNRLLLKTSNQSHNTALGSSVSHPYDFAVCLEMMDKNPHHSTCIKAKIGSTVGQGFLSLEELKIVRGEIEAKPAPTGGLLLDPQYATSEADTVLSPLTKCGFQDIQNKVCEDFMVTGNGYIEVVRKAISMKRVKLADNSGYAWMPHTDPSVDPIMQIYHMPSPEVKINVLSDGHTSYFEHSAGFLPRSFAGFGQTKALHQILFKSTNKNRPTVVSSIFPNHELFTYSEVIHFSNGSSRNPWYGLPDWLSGVSSIELALLETQFKSDFFYNRGVPDYLLSITGTEVASKQWDTIQKVVQAQIGPGNARKSMALNLPDETAKVDIHKLGLDTSLNSEFTQNRDSYALDIVTAHRVPPLLAGIMIPGKMGGNNEFINALKSFQTSPISQYQSLWQQIYGATLGNDLINGGLPLRKDNFHLRRITDLLDLGTSEVISRMRTPLPDAMKQGRSPADGLLR